MRCSKVKDLQKDGKLLKEWNQPSAKSMNLQSLGFVVERLTKFIENLMLSKSSIILV
jgi:hypothetical protein